ncbi:TPA: glycosyltransferase family 2 protein [Streptococcus suis]|nr:glycosyltransferase family 2 protein [Streptococcus suis]
MLYIFTPTYNRKHHLQQLYVSLLQQINRNFIWLLIDDGSSDQTNELVKEWQDDNQIQIIYEYQKNQGKHAAYNKALEIMGNDGFHVCVDSDDILSNEAVDIILQDCLRVSKLEEYVGVVYPKMERKSQLETKWLPAEVNSVAIPDIKLKFGLNIETCIVIKNEIASQYRFPIFESETFLSEETFYIFLSNYGSFIPYNSAVYYFDYLEGGLTNNIFSIWLRNPIGTLYFLNLRIQYILDNYKGIVRYREFCKATINRNAIQLAIEDYKWSQNYGVFDYLLLPLTILMKSIRFKIRTKN